MRRQVVAISLLAAVSAGCSATREFWRYVVEDEVEKPLAGREKGEPDVPRALSPHNVKVVYNDGKTSTEVLIPVLSSGQQIIVDHRSKANPQSLRVVPPPPAEADKSLEDAYLSSGQPVRQQAQQVSIVKTHGEIRRFVREGNFSMALEYAEQLLRRYPNHVKTLRTKGSLLLKMGEREAALKTYYKAQEVEPSPAVEQQIRQLENVGVGRGPGGGGAGGLDAVRPSGPPRRAQAPAAQPEAAEDEGEDQEEAAPAPAAKPRAKASPAQPAPQVDSQEETEAGPEAEGNAAAEEEQ